MTAKELLKELVKEKYDRKNLRVLVNINGNLFETKDKLEFDEATNSIIFVADTDNSPKEAPGITGQELFTGLSEEENPETDENPGVGGVHPKP